MLIKWSTGLNNQEWFLWYNLSIYNRSKLDEHVVCRNTPADRSDMLRDDRSMMRGSSPSDRYRRTRDRSRSRERRRRSRSRERDARRRERHRSGEREIKKEPVDETGAGVAG